MNIYGFQVGIISCFVQLERRGKIREWVRVRLEKQVGLDFEGIICYFGSLNFIMKVVRVRGGLYVGEERDDIRYGKIVWLVEGRVV